jgi:hypothetical protein
VAGHLLGPAEPFGVALVGVAVDAVFVDVGDGGRDGVGDLAQALLAAAQGLGDGRLLSTAAVSSRLARVRASVRDAMCSSSSAWWRLICSAARRCSVTSVYTVMKPW